MPDELKPSTSSPTECPEEDGDVTKLLTSRSGNAAITAQPTSAFPAATTSAGVAAVTQQPGAATPADGDERTKKTDLQRDTSCPLCCDPVCCALTADADCMELFSYLCCCCFLCQHCGENC